MLRSDPDVDAGRRDPRRGDRAHRDPGRDDRTPRARRRCTRTTRPRRSRGSKDMGVEPSLLATSINCIVAQRLARRLCVDCREAVRARDRRARTSSASSAGRARSSARSAACSCGGTGYRGRVALYEVMPIHGHIRRLIEASTEEIFAAAVEEGMPRCARTASGSCSRASRRSTRSAASPATGSSSSTLEVFDPRGVGLGAGPDRARELVVPVRLGRPGLASRGAAERVVRVVVGRFEISSIVRNSPPPPASAEAEVRDPERLADRGLVRLAASSPSRAARSPARSCPYGAASAFPEEVVRLAHRPPDSGSSRAAGRTGCQVRACARSG